MDGDNVESSLNPRLAIWETNTETERLIVDLVGKNQEMHFELLIPRRVSTSMSFIIMLTLTALQSLQRIGGKVDHCDR